MRLDNLLERLAKRDTTSVVYNQYRNPNVLNNLKIYLEYLLNDNSKILLVGEAPGYNGCKITGIPFTSGDVIKSKKSSIFKKIGKHIVIDEIKSEITATILWQELEKYSKLPILWNCFPFHPHKEGDTQSNRKPTEKETNEGVGYLLLIYNIFNPTKLCSLGKVSQKVLNDKFPDESVVYIRHPSHGGKRDFIAGIEKIMPPQYTEPKLIIPPN